jgi:hypothetical protein
MKPRVTRRQFLAIAGTALGGMVGVLPAGARNRLSSLWYTSVSPSISVVPATVEPGAQVTIAGSGFGAWQRGTLSFAGASVATFTVNGQGSFSLAWTVPQTTRAATYTLGAVTSSATASATLTIQAAQIASLSETSPMWALIGNDGTHLSEESAAGINTKLFRLSWREYFPAANTASSTYVARKRAELSDLRSAGFAIILTLGYHDTPAWVHQNYPNSYYVNQFGQPYVGETIDSGDANLVFNPALRSIVDAYIARIFSDFGTDFAAVRLGGGRNGELTYPPAVWNGGSNNYWGYDANARSSSPAPRWLPGQSSPAHEAQRFLDWYLGALVGYQTWQTATLRKHYAGDIMMLYPGWGIRPGQIDQAVAANLNGSTSAERNGEIQRGYDYARQITAIKDPKVIVTTTWLDADAAALAAPGDQSTDPRQWSPVKYLASLAAAHPLKPRLFGENTGWGSRTNMDRTAAQAIAYGLMGMMWFREDQLFSGQYASLADFQQVIAATKFSASAELR